MNVFYANRKSNIIHKDGCHYLKQHNTVYSIDKMGLLCRHCFPNCMICCSQPGLSMPCQEHNMCLSCLKVYLTRTTDLVCPCGKGGCIDPRSLPIQLFEKWKESSCAVEKCKECPVSKFENTILNLRCPWCSSVFYDFDACLALHCRCKRWFCGLCLAKIEGDSQNAHDHVLSCQWNHQNDYYMNMEQWNLLQRKNCRRRIRNYLMDVIRSESLLYSFGICFTCVYKSNQPYFHLFILYSYCTILLIVQALCSICFAPFYVSFKLYIFFLK